MNDGFGSTGERWRVVVFTNFPGGGVYHQVNEVLRPLGHRIVGVVTTPGPRQRRSRDYLSVVESVQPGIDTIVSSHPGRLAEMLAPFHPDLIISGGFPWLIPADVIALPRVGAINMHPSLLPRHRGPHALEWALRSGDPELGFTIHWLDSTFDTGPILAQGSVPIGDEDDAASIIQRLPQISPGLLGKALSRVAQGERGEPQDELKATYAGTFEDEWRTIDWVQPARLIHNQVRSWTGFRGVPKGAIGMVDGSPLTITSTRLLDGGTTTHMTPGTVLRHPDDRLIIQCGDDQPIEIVSSFREDGDSQAH